MGWTVRGSNPGGGEIFRTCPDRPWGSPSLLYNGYWFFPGGKKRPGHDADPSPPSTAVGHKRVELYLYSPYGESIRTDVNFELISALIIKTTELAVVTRCDLVQQYWYFGIVCFYHVDESSRFIWDLCQSALSVPESSNHLSERSDNYYCLWDPWNSLRISADPL